MRYFIRADASEHLGTGHIMRCLSLSVELIRKKHTVVFVCRLLHPYLRILITNQGCDILEIESKEPVGSTEESEYVVSLIKKEYAINQTDWIIVDHYSISYSYESILRNLFSNILVIDDLADRRHDCDMLLDTNLNNGNEKYNKLVASSVTQLIGPKYALLRQEFLDERSNINDKFPEHIQSIFVCFGGTDPSNETLKTIKALEPVLNDITKVKIVLGRTNPHVEELINLFENNSKLEFLIQPSSIAQEMVSCDMAICAGGSMTWERYCMGLPAIVIAIADNQIEVANYGQSIGIDKYIGVSSLVTEADITRSIRQLVHPATWLREARELAMESVDGNGVSRVVNYLI
ncbi:UDP-2,4-diacetamido-2,4,6-trideoxy-beta-L-altropyranose hydrolase [Paenibacillus sp. FSL K6-0276]|uniref:UDP-2,4-diacetamido-2,4, 6-trideoxy-beta-L-altropyranose hydrolase n=1 Tax=Paenibacillus sp. FSL K6-0276 TaxID=2921450 RepID=UPI0030EF2D63